MTVLRRAGITLSTAVLILLALVPRATVAGATPYNANPQQHCNASVCVGAQSFGGSGPDIANVEVQTRGLFPVPVGTWMWARYGPNPTIAKSYPALAWCETTKPGVDGCTWGIGRTLIANWYICGQILNLPGYPCIKIGL